jgi:hypothetical protein
MIFCTTKKLNDCSAIILTKVVFLHLLKMNMERTISRWLLRPRLLLDTVVLQCKGWSHTKQSVSLQPHICILTKAIVKLEFRAMI